MHLVAELCTWFAEQILCNGNIKLGAWRCYVFADAADVAGGTGDDDVAVVGVSLRAAGVVS